MRSIIKLFDYMGAEYIGLTGAELSISKIVIEVITGDEVMTITMKDGNVIKKDPAGKIRLVDYFDYSYVIYDEEKGIDVTNEDWFVNRTGSYDVINNYPVTKDYILDYDLSDGTSSYIKYEVIEMLPGTPRPFKMFDENIANTQKLMVSDAYEMLGMPEDPRYVGWYWAWDPAGQKQGLFNEKGERVQ